MQELNILEDEFEGMLKNFKQMLDFLGAGDMGTLQQDLKNLSSLITRGSKRIDDVVDESELFTLNETELDQRMEELDKEHFELSDKVVATKKKLEKAREGLNKSLKELNEVTEVQQKASNIFDIVPDFDFEGRVSPGQQQSHQENQNGTFELKDEVKSEQISEKGSQKGSQKWPPKDESEGSIDPAALFDVEF